MDIWICRETGDGGNAGDPMTTWWIACLIHVTGPLFRALPIHLNPTVDHNILIVTKIQPKRLSHWFFSNVDIIGKPNLLNFGQYSTSPSSARRVDFHGQRHIQVDLSNHTGIAHKVRFCPDKLAPITSSLRDLATSQDSFQHVQESL